MFRILGSIVAVILILIGLTFVANRGGHEDYDAELFKPGPVLGLVKGLSDDTLEGRKIGTPGSRRAQDMIEARMQAMDLLRLGSSYRMPFETVLGSFADGSTEQVEGVNLVAVVQGTDPSGRVIVVTAHYDHLGVGADGEIYNGADDNASGVATLFAIADHFTRKKTPPKHSLILLVLDGEEQGSHGAKAFLEDQGGLPPGAITFNLNLDMISRADNGKLWASGVPRTPSLRAILETVSETAPIELNIGYDGANAEQDDWTLMSDHREFLRAGIPHLYLGVEDHPDYHKPTDDFENVDQDVFLKSVETCIMVLRAIDTNLDEVLAGFDPDWKPAGADKSDEEAEQE